MTVAMRRLLTMFILSLLVNTASAIRAGSFASVRVGSTNPGLPSSLSDSLFGCPSKALARDLVILCNRPQNAKMLTEDCCRAAVGTIGRPSCFCRVKREQAFGMSELLNATNLVHLLSRCGASRSLIDSASTACPVSDGEEFAYPRTTPNDRGRCSKYKVSSYVAWFLFGLTLAAVISDLLWSPTPTERQRIQMLRRREDQDQRSLADQDQRSLADQDQRSPAERTIEMVLIGNNGVQRSPDTTTQSLSTLHEKKLKRRLLPNTKYIGGQWYNGPVKKYRKN